MLEKRRVSAQGGLDRTRIIEQDRRDRWIVEHSSAVKQQTETLHDPNRPSVLLEQPIDWQLAANRRPRVGTRVKCGPHAFDIVSIKCGQQRLFWSRHVGERLFYCRLDVLLSRTGRNSEVVR